MTTTSATWQARLDRLRQEWNDYAGNQGTVFDFQLNEQQVLDLASGYVPLDIRSMCLAALDWREDDRRRAERGTLKREATS